MALPQHLRDKISARFDPAEDLEQGDIDI
jgi:hypothetical protein